LHARINERYIVNLKLLAIYPIIIIATIEQLSWIFFNIKIMTYM